MAKKKAKPNTAMFGLSHLCTRFLSIQIALKSLNKSNNAYFVKVTRMV